MPANSISPCPFCASDQVTSVEIDIDRWSIVCNSCGGLGPATESLAEAKEAWNGRQVLAQNLGLIRSA